MKTSQELFYQINQNHIELNDSREIFQQQLQSIKQKAEVPKNQSRQPRSSQPYASSQVSPFIESSEGKIDFPTPIQILKGVQTGNIGSKGNSPEVFVNDLFSPPSRFSGQTDEFSLDNQSLTESKFQFSASQKVPQTKNSLGKQPVDRKVVTQRMDNNGMNPLQTVQKVQSIMKKYRDQIGYSQLTHPQQVSFTLNPSNFANQQLQNKILSRNYTPQHLQSQYIYTSQYGPIKNPVGQVPVKIPQLPLRKKKKQAEVKDEKTKTIYTGQTLQGQKEGFGELKSYNGKLIYKGYWKNNKFHGWGSHYNHASQKSAMAHKKLSGIENSWSEYEGNFLNGFHHGQGSLTFADGSKYDGDFFKGVPHGVGIFTYQKGKYSKKGDGNVYGTWVNGIVQD